MLKPIDTHLVNRASTTSSSVKKNPVTETSSKDVKQDIGVIVDINKETPKTVTYGKTKNNVGQVDMNEVWKTTQKFTENFRSMIKELLSKQGIAVSDVLEGKKIATDENGKALAAEAISENGEFGVKNVTERIVSFAKVLANGDKGKISELREAIKQGFAEAEKMLGELPEISKETFKAVMKELDSWEEEGNTTSEKEEVDIVK